MRLSEQLPFKPPKHMISWQILSCLSDSTNCSVQLDRWFNWTDGSTGQTVQLDRRFNMVQLDKAKLECIRILSTDRLELAWDGAGCAGRSLHFGLLEFVWPPLHILSSWAVLSSWVVSLWTGYRSHVHITKYVLSSMPLPLTYLWWRLWC